MGIIIGRLAAWIVGGMVTIFGGWKTFILGLVMAALAVIIHNVLIGLVENLLQSAVTQVQGQSVSGGSYTLSLSGVAAYIAILLKLPECLSITMSCVSVRVMLKAIPFVKVN